MLIRATGNIARNDTLLNSLKKASEEGVVIINTSQCHSGSVSAAYENGRLLGEAGVVAGNDLTSEVCEVLTIKLATNTSHRLRSQNSPISCLHP